MGGEAKQAWASSIIFPKLVTGLNVFEVVGCCLGLGFQLESWSRVPYLCEGDLEQPLYSLDDFVMVFKKIQL